MKFNILFFLMLSFFTPIVLEMHRFFWTAFRSYADGGDWSIHVNFDNFTGEIILNIVWYNLAVVFLCVGWLLLGTRIADYFRKDK